VIGFSGFPNEPEGADQLAEVADPPIEPFKLTTTPWQTVTALPALTIRDGTGLNVSVMDADAALQGPVGLLVV
jgi:hypothetical protein